MMDRVLETQTPPTELAVLRAENERLRAALLRSQEAERECRRRQGRAEAELAHVLRLRTASLRLQEARAPVEVWDALLEVLVNLVGSETLGLYALEPGCRELGLCVSVGIDAERFRWLPLGECPVSQATLTGRPWVEPLLEAAGSASAAEPRACVPLKFGGRVLGVIILFGLLPHKPCLEPGDRELLELLALEGGRALYCARGLAAGWPS